MNLLFDSWSSQVLLHQTPPSYPPDERYPPSTGARLSTLLSALKSLGSSAQTPWEIRFTVPPITPQQLEGIDVYISLTRCQGVGFAYSKDELETLQRWSQQGGHILLMSNHGGFPTDRENDWTSNNEPLAALFGVSLQNYSVQNWNNPPNASNRLEVLDTIPYVANQARYIGVRNSCVLAPSPAKRFIPIAYFPASWTAYNPKTDEYIDPPTPYFALLVPGENDAGSFLVTGNSGWVGDYGSRLPACGLITYENNLMFVLNCISYLGGMRQIPAWGKCPVF